MNPLEIHVRTVEDTPLYRVDQVRVWSLGRYEDMLKLMLKIHGKLVFVRRYDMAEAETKLREHLERLRETFDKGYLCLYGRGHPLEEFTDPLDEITSLDDTEAEGVKRFGGNHREYSAAFNYLIWNRELIEEIERRLREVV